MRAAATVLLSTGLLCIVGFLPAQSLTSYGPQNVDSTNQGGPWLLPAQRGLSYTHDLSTGAVSFRLAPWGVIKSARGPSIPFALVFYYGLGISMDGSLPFKGQWTSNGPPASTVAATGSWAETTPTVSMSWVDTVDQFGDECNYVGPYIFTDFSGIGHDLGLGQIEYMDTGATCLGGGSSASQALDQPSLYAAFTSGSNFPASVTDGGSTRYYFNWSSGQGS